MLLPAARGAIETRSVTQKLNALKTPTLPSLGSGARTGVPSREGSIGRDDIEVIDQRQLAPREPAGVRPAGRPLPSQQPRAADVNGNSSVLPALHLSVSPRSNGNGIPQKGRLEYSRSEGVRLSAEDANSGCIEYRPLEVGLENLGNTCFMNASLQCLLHIRSLVSFFLRNDCNALVNPDSPFKGSLARSFSALCRDVFTSKKSAYAPTQFQRSVAAVAPQLLDLQQQDCHEFLRFLLDGMCEDLCRRPVVAPSLQPSSSGTSPYKLRSISGSGAGAGSNLVIGAAAAAASITADEGQVPEPDANSIDALTDAAASLSLSENHQEPVAEARNGTETVEENESDYAAGSVAPSDKPPAGAGVTVSTHSQGRRKLVQRGAVAGATRGPGVELGEEIKTQPADAAPSTAVSTDTSAPVPVNPITEAAKAWDMYLRKNDSIITDLFAGQLQSVIECQTCRHRSMCFDPFLDLALPLPKAAEPARGGLSSLRRGAQEAKCTLEECFAKFTADELLEGEEMFNCEACKTKRQSVKRLSLYRLPPILVVQIKRFRYSAISRDKLQTDVVFPVTGLDLGEYASSDRPQSPDSEAEGSATDATAGRSSSPTSTSSCVYDLMGVSSHSGSMHGGHYIATVDINGGEGAPKWVCFNDGRATVAAAPPTGPSAYVLFYRRRDTR